MLERCGYKVVTYDMKSLGLRKNPNILTYPLAEWYKLPDDWIIEGNEDWGGIWVARKKGGARTLQRYMKDKYDINARIFLSKLGRILFENSYRIKTDAIFMVDEIY